MKGISWLAKKLLALKGLYVTELITYTSEAGKVTLDDAGMQ